MKPIFIHWAWLSLAAVLLSACGTSPPQKSTPESPRTEVKREPLPVRPGIPATTSPLPSEPVDPLKAAQKYLDQAQSEPSPQREDAQLKATAALIRAGKLRQAQELLDTIDVVGLPDIYRARFQVLRAVTALHHYQPKRALTMLAPLFALKGLGPEVQADIYQLRAQANLMLQRRLDSVLDLIAREAYLSSADRLQLNRARTWQVLGSMNRFELEQARFKSADDILNGWLDLALLRLEFGSDPFVFAQAVKQWQQSYVHHSAQSIVNSQLQTLNSAAAPQRPNRVALLLPLASKFGRAAQAVHDGFMAAHHANGDPSKPAVAVYDVGEESTLTPVYYRLAVQEGADFVVGPLGKAAVNGLLSSGTVTTPTLLLGSSTVTSNSSAPIYQFDLAPEQEAQQAAQRAYLDGHRIAAALYPESEWGQRMITAFTEEWESLGGVTAEKQSYNETSSDFSTPIKALLNIDESERRSSGLAAQLGTKLQFEPRRRQDVDCLFLAAQVKSARLLKPQINFYRGHDIPVYATSHVYTGKKDPVNDADLNGIIFGDMPWLLSDQGRMPALRERIQKDWPDQHSPLDRLYALGMDAYAIIFHLPRLVSDPGARIAGATANLSLVDNRINRYLTWARFEQGRPVVKDVIVDKKGIESISLESQSLTTDPALEADPASGTVPAPTTRTVGGS